MLTLADQIGVIIKNQSCGPRLALRASDLRTKEPGLRLYHLLSNRFDAGRFPVRLKCSDRDFFIFMLSNFTNTKGLPSISWSAEFGTTSLFCWETDSVALAITNMPGLRIIWGLLISAAPPRSRCRIEFFTRSDHFTYKWLAWSHLWSEFTRALTLRAATSDCGTSSMTQTVFKSTIENRPSSELLCVLPELFEGLTFCPGEILFFTMTPDMGLFSGSSLIKLASDTVDA